MRLKPQPAGEKSDENAASTSADAQEPARLLLKNHLAGKEEAFADLMHMYRDQVYSYIFRSGVAQGSRDDVFQEIFINIHRNAKRYDASRPLAPWIFTIALNTVRSHFRKQKSQGNMSLADVSYTPGTSETAQQLSEAQATAEFLEKEIAALNQHEREAFLLCCLKDMEQAEVANILNIPLNTVKSHVRRVRLHLAKKLQERAQRLEKESSHE